MEAFPGSSTPLHVLSGAKQDPRASGEELSRLGQPRPPLEAAGEPDLLMISPKLEQRQGGNFAFKVKAGNLTRGVCDGVFTWG